MSGFEVIREGKERAGGIARFQFLCSLGDQRLPCTGKKDSSWSSAPFAHWTGGLFSVCTNAWCCVLWLLGFVRSEDEDIHLGHNVSGEIIEIWM